MLHYSIYSFGGRVKELAFELFGMRNKDRSLLINVASKMREIDANVWAKYVIHEIEKDNKEKCIIDDLRFQNEADYLSGWKFISLTTSKELRIERIKKVYPNNYEDHIKNIDHISETDKINLPNDTIYIDTSINYDELENVIIDLIS